MIRSDKIKVALIGGVGFRQSPLTEFAIVDLSNQTSDSGLFYQDASSIVTIENIKECQQAKDIFDEDFNIYLKQLQESVIIEVCRAVTVNESDFIQDANLYPFEKVFKNTIEKRGKFVGFGFEPSTNRIALSKLNYVELMFDSDATFNLYLYNSNKPNAPIKTLSVTSIANEAVIVNLDDWFIADDATHKGGSFYAGYFEDDLGSAKALKKDYNLGQLQVSTACSFIRPVSLTHSSTVIDVESVIEENDTYGLNLGISVYNDYTELIIKNKNLFWEAIQLQMAEKVLNIIKATNRTNRVTRSTEVKTGDIDFDLFGNPAFKVDGITTKLKRSIDDLRNMLFRRPTISRGTLS